LYDALSPVVHGAGVLAEIALAPRRTAAAIEDDDGFF
jgi:hypothetical protein